MTAQGSFDDTVNLSCGNLPSGASCNFLPSGSVNPTSSSPVAVTLTVSTTADATAGTVPITINGSVTNGPTKTQSLSLTITPDYSLAISNPSLQAYVNSTVNFNGVLTSLNGYNSGVNLSCGTGAPPTCSAAPALVVPTTSGAPFIVTVGSPACGSYNFNIVAVGTDAQKTTHLVSSHIHSDLVYDAKLHTGDRSAFPDGFGKHGHDLQRHSARHGLLQQPGEFELRIEPSAELQRFPEQRYAHREPRAGCAVHRNCEQRGRADLQLQRCKSGYGCQQNRHILFLLAFTSTGSGSGTGFASPSHHLQHSVLARGTARDLRSRCGAGRRRFPNNASLAYSANCPPLSTCTVSPTQVNKGISGDTQVTFTITTTAPVIAGVHPAPRGRSSTRCGFRSRGWL